MDYTKEQLQIITHSGGHARVSAVAGSGKTTTMVERVGYLLQQGTPPENILILMFNRSARDCFASSLKERFGNSHGKLPEVRTFHALGNRLVASFSRRGALPAYRLVTEEYVLEKLARQAVQKTYQAVEGGAGYPVSEEIEDFLTFIDLVKATTANVSTVFKTQGLSANYSYFIEAFELFEKIRKQQGIRFFSDLIYEPLVVMLADNEIHNWVSNRVSHILVDEYQDINEAQQQLLKILAGNRARVMVVGDVDQCIYEWRGARPEYITDRFQLDFRQPIEYKLSYTFRYGHTLSLAANHLIANNSKRDSKLCLSHPSTPVTEITIHESSGAKELTACLQKWLAEGRKLTEAVVLVRLFAQTIPVELALLEASIPYILEGSDGVFECQEILALTGYLRLVDGSLPSLDPAVRQQFVAAMLCQPHLGLKRQELNLLVQQISAAPESAVQILEGLQDMEQPLFLQKRFQQTASAWQEFTQLSADKPAAELLRSIVSTLQLYDFYHKFSARMATAENRIKTCETFIAFTADKNLSIEGLFNTLAELRCRGDRQVAERLLITSVHRAKGLEWPLVILPGLEDGFFPLCKDGNGMLDSLEDERRLFYVAMTRAKEHLVCFHPTDKKLENNIKKKRQRLPQQRMQASQFLYEVNLGLCRTLGPMLSRATEGMKVYAEDLALARLYLKAVGVEVELELSGEDGECDPEQQLSYLKADEIEPGIQVSHPVLGKGTVCSIKDRKQGRLEVDFAEHGKTILLLRYAKLQQAGSQS